MLVLYSDPSPPTSKKGETFHYSQQPSKKLISKKRKPCMGLYYCISIPTVRGVNPPLVDCGSN